MIQTLPIVPHSTAANRFARNDARAHWHDQALWFIRTKRDRMAQSLPEWEALRERASAIKSHTVSRLAEYLEEFEREATARGAIVHWAADAREHNEIILKILRRHGVRKVAKSKSMLTEECHLNPWLQQNGIEVVDTDLGEWIVQLRDEPPSHIVLPAIHIKKEEVGELFHDKLGTEKGATDPKYLAEAARRKLREVFLGCDAGITGANFAVAETGGVVVCTNEGNADLGVALPKLHIAALGIEKLIPRAADLGVFLRLLARSATGQPITAYTSHFHGPRPGGELHIVLVDNGRSEILGSDEFRRSLHCIRCGACMNTCPVYRRSGGHSYSATVPGPIGSILNPARDPKGYSSLPYACSLCGSCSDVCPVKINIHEQLLGWRKEIAAAGHIALMKRLGMRATSYVFNHPDLYGFLGKVARFALRITPKFLVNGPWNPWGKQRDLPAPPKSSFRDEYRRRQSSR